MATLSKDRRPSVWEAQIAVEHDSLHLYRDKSLVVPVCLFMVRVRGRSIPTWPSSHRQCLNEAYPPASTKYILHGFLIFFNNIAAYFWRTRRGRMIFLLSLVPFLSGFQILVAFLFLVPFPVPIALSPFPDVLTLTHAPSPVPMLSIRFGLYGHIPEPLKSHGYFAVL